MISGKCRPPCTVQYLIVTSIFGISTPLLFMFNIDALSTATATRPFWSQDIHSRMPFHAYEFPLDVPLLGHYSIESAFKKGYSVEETVSRELVKHANYTGDLYGIIIDGGSTGTRISAFHFVKASRPPYMRLITECGKHLKPGLSYYAADPENVHENIAPLIHRAKECIPQYLWKTTPLELKATAGLRLLPGYAQNRILDNAKDYIRNYSPFVLSHDESVSIMEGIDEGLYSWITVNYLLETLHHHYEGFGEYEGKADGDGEHSIKKLLRREKLKQQTFGTLDLGGGSMQITFVPIYDSTVQAAPKEFIHDVKIFGEKLKLYSWSYLGFGLMSARMQMFGLAIEDPRHSFQSANNHLFSPCIHSGVEFVWQHASTDYVITGSPLNPESPSSFHACYSQAVDIISLSIHHEWEVSKESFYAFSYFYDVAVEAGIIPHVAGGQVEVGVFKRNARDVCNGIGDERGQKPFLCMDLSYISALLIDGLGFKERQTVVLQKKINGVETSWALGAMFHLLNTFHNTSQIELTSKSDGNR